MDQLPLSPEQLRALQAQGILDVPALYELCTAVPESLAQLLGCNAGLIAEIAAACEARLPVGYLDRRAPLPPLGVIVSEEEKNHEPKDA